MENTNIKKIIMEWEDLSGKMKDVKDFNSLISNILKKKNSKNQVEILINFINNLKEIKNELKSDKKIIKSVYTVLFSLNGEEHFIQEFLSKLQDRSCTNLLNQIKENLSKFSYQNIFARLKNENSFFEEKYKSCEDHSVLIQTIMRSQFTEENILFHFFNFWNKIETSSEELNGEKASNSIFSNLKNFKNLFLESFKNAITSARYSRTFLKEFMNRKIPKEFEKLFGETEISSRLKIDLFFEEFLQIQNFRSLLSSLFEASNEKVKTNIFFEFLHELEKFRFQYKAEKYFGTIFESIFSELGVQKFLTKLSEEFCNNAPKLFLKCPKFFEIFKSRLYEFKVFEEEIKRVQISLKNANNQAIFFLEEIKGNSYDTIANNLLQYTLDDLGHLQFSKFLQNEVKSVIYNYILINDTMCNIAPYLDIISKSKQFFVDNLMNSMIANKNFKSHRVYVLTSAVNSLPGIKTETISKITTLKEGLKLKDRKEFRHLYSRYLAWEIDINFLLDFIPKNDFEKISLLVNRLIRSGKYEDCLTVLNYSEFDSRIHIDGDYEWELSDFSLYDKKLERPVKYAEGDEDANVADREYDANFDENLDDYGDSDDSDLDEDSKRENKFKLLKANESSKKKKKIQDYIMYYQYMKPKKLRDIPYYSNLLKKMNFMPNFRQDNFSPVTPNSLTLEVPKANVLMIDTIESLKANLIIFSKKVCIDFEYSGDTISIMQISDKNNVFIIDYLKLISHSNFFQVFTQVFKNSTFIAFSIDGSDLNMMNEEFRNYFKQTKVEDVKLMYEKIYINRKCPSLSNLAFYYLGKPLCKYYQCSNWEQRPLLEGQFHYAALDSHVLFKIYSHLESINPSEIKEKDSMYDKIHKTQEKQLKYKLNKFAESQIPFLENERQMIEDTNKDLTTKSLCEILRTHKVINHARYAGYDKSEKIYSFEFRDTINLIKVGEKVGIFEISKKGMLKEITRGIADSMSPGTISIRESKYDVADSLKNVPMCIIQLSDDVYRTMINTIKKLRNGLIPKYCLDVVKTCFPIDILKYKYDEPEVLDLAVHYNRTNKVQKQVINFALQKTLPVSLIYGPPGTGKSQVIKEIILQSLKKGEKVLVTAFSNAGCDNLASLIHMICLDNFKMYKKDQFLRIGNISKIKPALKEISMEERENSSFYKICLNRIQKTDYTKEDKSLVSERQNFLYNKLNTYKDILLLKSNVIFSTCVSSGSFSMRKYLENHKTYFDLVIIDEASQALEAACWIPMLLGKKVIIVGDFKQIGPIVNSNNIQYSYTLFEKLYKLYGDEISRMLTIQFRMHKKIMEFPSNYFYEGLLIADDSVADRTLKDRYFKNGMTDSLDLFKEPLILVDTRGESEETKVSTTKYNKGEANVVKWFVDYLTRHGVRGEDIGVITPYAGQVYYIKEMIKENIDVSSVDAFQGSEKEVIIISFVRSNNYSEIGFLSDKKRINVSLTRPRKMLVIICDSSTLDGNDFLKEMIKFYMKKSKILNNNIIFENI